MDRFNLSNLQIRSVICAEEKGNPLQCKHLHPILKYHELIYIAKGEATVVIDDTVILNKPGEIVFLPKGEYSNYDARVNKDEVCIDIFFEADTPLAFIPTAKNFLNNAKLSLLFEKIHQAWQRKETGYYNRCMSLFYSILYEMELSSRKYLPRYKSDKLNAAMEYIHSHYTDVDFDYAVLPSLCGISYTYFKNLFIERFHATPSEYVRNLKIKRACELLITNKLSITQVATACGFSDVYYFSKVFKQICGIPPSKWK